MPRILAIDYGTVRLGIALSDETKKIAFAKPYIKTQDKEKILDLIREQEVGEILLGLPTGLSGQETKMTEEVKQFADWLGQSNIPIKFIDERLTSEEVKKGLRGERGIKGLVDSLVAQKILERYLRTKERKNG